MMKKVFMSIYNKIINKSQINGNIKKSMIIHIRIKINKLLLWNKPWKVRFQIQFIIMILTLKIMRDILFVIIYLIMKLIFQKDGKMSNIKTLNKIVMEIHLQCNKQINIKYLVKRTIMILKLKMINNVR